MDDSSLEPTMRDETREERLQRLREKAREDADASVERGAAARSAALPTEPEPPKPLTAAEVDYVRGSPVLRFWLDHPFRRDGRMVRAIDLVPPTYADVLATVAGFRRHTETFAAMSGLSEAEIAALRWSDAERLIKLCHALMPDISGV